MFQGTNDFEFVNMVQQQSQLSCKCIWHMGSHMGVSKQEAHQIFAGDEFISRGNQQLLGP